MELYGIGTWLDLDSEVGNDSALQFEEDADDTHEVDDTHEANDTPKETSARSRNSRDKCLQLRNLHV